MTKEQFIGIATLGTMAFAIGIFLIAVYALGYSTAAFGVLILGAVLPIAIATSLYHDMKSKNLIKQKSIYDESDIDFIDTSME